MIDVHRLRVFRSVVASGSVQAAATNLGYTPSAISQHINQLQRETGLTLFEKAGRGLAPTPTGLLLAQQSEDALSTLSRLDEVVANLRSGRTGSLSISCFASAGEEWIPQLVQRLRASSPEVMVTVDLNELVPENTIGCDLIVRTERTDVPTPVPPDYTRHSLGTEPYVVVLPGDHRLANRASLELADLADEPWVDDSLEGQVCAQILRRALAQAGIAPRIAARCQDHHTAFALTAAGVGVTLVPRLTTGALPSGTVAIALSAPVVERGIAVLVRTAASPSPVTRQAVALLREIVTGTADAA